MHIEKISHFFLFNFLVLFQYAAQQNIKPKKPAILVAGFFCVEYNDYSTTISWVMVAAFRSISLTPQ